MHYNYILLIIGCGNVFTLGWLVGRKSRDVLSYVANGMSAVALISAALI